jgi:uncharacterized membrane protein
VSKGRLEAFSDGVIAIIITIMVLELRPPEGVRGFDVLVSLRPVFLSYILSFIYLGIYWNNHHHMLRVTKRVTGRVMWANLHLLFWLSLVPFTTGWIGREFDSESVAVYGVVLLMAALAYTILQLSAVAADGADSLVARAIGSDLKGYASLALYVVGVISALYDPRIASLLYVTVAIIWLIPDRRIERVVAQYESTETAC